MTNIFLGLFVGIILGILIDRFLFPMLDILLDVYNYKQTNIATEHQLNTQMMTMEFLREYPEANKNYQELSPAIGFAVSSPGEFEEEFEEDECCKSNIGFK